MSRAKSLVVVLSGPPGSGKSRLCRGLREGSPVPVTHVDLDALFRQACERDHVSPLLLESGACAGEGVTPKGQEDAAAARAAAWHSARRAAIEAVAKALAERNRDLPLMVLVDDTSEHRSWRRAIASTARNHGAALLVLELMVPPALAEARNAARPLAEQVPLESLRRVTLQLQDTTASVLRGSVGRSGRGAAAWESAFLSRVPAEGSPAEVLSLARAALEGAWENLLPAPAARAGEASEASSTLAGAYAPCTAARSDVHSCDLRMRDAVSACMASVAAARRGSAAAAAGPGEVAEGPLLGAELAASLQTAESPLSLANAARVLRAAKLRGLDAARAAAATEAPSSSDDDVVWKAARAAMLAACFPAADF